MNPFKSLNRDHVPSLLLMGLSLLCLLIFCLQPFAVLFYKSLWDPASQSLSGRWYGEVFLLKTLGRATTNTLVVSFSVGALSVLCGVPLAWLVSRTDLPWRSALRSWLALPYAIPPFIGAIAWVFWANPTNGVLNQVLGEGTINIYSLFGLIFVETSFLFTIVFLATLSALDSMDPSLEEAARVSGATGWQVFQNIAIPLIQPTILSSFLMVVLATSASFGVPALIGSPARLHLLTTQIYTLQKMGTLKGLYMALALSFLLLSVSLGLLALQQWYSKSRNFQTVSGKTARPSEVRLGSYQIPLLIGVLGFLVLILGLPLLGIALSAFGKVPGKVQLDLLTLDHFRSVFLKTPETIRALTNSLHYAGLAATLATLLGFLLAYLLAKTRLPLRAWIEALSALPFATPGTVVAIALILTFSQGIWGVGPALYGTSFLIVVAYIVKYLSYSIQTNKTGLLQIHDVLAEAARVSGASWITTLWTIWLPLMRKPLLTAWLMMCLPCLSELTMTLLLGGPGQETIGTLIFQMQEYADVSGGSAGVLSLVVIGFVLVIQSILHFLDRRVA